MWAYGFVSALGIGLVRGLYRTADPAGGGIAGLLLLAGLAAGLGFESAAVTRTRALLARYGAVPRARGWLAGLVVALGSAGMIALNTVLTVGPGSLPPFGPVSVALLCLPYPMAFALLRVRCRGVAAVTVVAAVSLAALVVPLRRAQEALAADACHGLFLRC
jgi:hypothetical protein